MESRSVFASGSKDRYGRAESVTSFGDNLEKNQVWSVDSAQYKAYTELLTRSLRKIVDREQVRKDAAQTTVLTIGLSSDKLAALSASYPEFRIKLLPLSNPVHAVWVASRRLGNLWMAQAMSSYTTDYIHLGGSAFQHMLHSNGDVHVETDALSPVAANEIHELTVAAYRLFSKPTTLQEAMEAPIDPSMYTKFLHGQSWRTCTHGAQCQHQATGYLFDLTLTALSPTQVCAAMVQADARVGYAMLPYHPSVLVQDSGELPGMGVRFVKSSTDLVFQYSEGVAGVTNFSLRAYAGWLVQQYIPYGRRKDLGFRFELMRQSGSFLFVRVVRVSAPQDSVPLMHALELPLADDMTIVRAWALRDLVADPYKDSSWCRQDVLVSSRVLQRAREHALALPQKEFSRYAIRKRLEVANDRFIVQGTSVTVNPVLSSGQLDLLECAIYAEVFVQRYEAGRLASELMGRLREMVEFGQASYASKFAIMFRAGLAGLWKHTFGLVSEWIGQGLDALRRMFRRIPKERITEYLDPPKYLLLSDAASQRREMFGMTWSKMVDSVASTSLVHAAVAGAYLVPAFVGEGSVEESQFSAQVLTSCHGTVDYYETMSTGVDVPLRDEVVSRLRQINEIGQAPVTRHVVELQSVSDVPDEQFDAVNYQVDPDYVGTMDRVHEAACPGVAGQQYAYDSFSISLDDQDRTMSAPYLKAPSYFGDVPRTRSYYVSNLSTYNVPKRQMTAQEMLSATAARNFSAPVLASPQDFGKMIPEVWDVFLTEACVPDARAKLAAFQEDPVGLEDEALKQWVDRAKPETLASMKRDLVDAGESLEQMPVGEYMAMLKSDVKPPVSDKPTYARVEPQVIVYHRKALSALYSSIFRVLTRRFLSLLKPNYCVNLLKDMEGVEKHINANHVWGEKLRYLENDFSKYDKSQAEFDLALEEFVYRQLGFRDDLLDRWVDGHVKSAIRVITLGMSFHVEYQRKSGDAATSFGNVIINVLSVTYAYRGTDVVWAVFQGDDSTLCARSVSNEKNATVVLAEIFNLQAKMFILDAPYFASNFVLVDDANKRVKLLPDPIKRIEKWSMAIPAEDPQWQERYVSHSQACAGYLHAINVAYLVRAVKVRYSMPDDANCEGIADAIATAISSYDRFRRIWSGEPQEVRA